MLFLAALFACAAGMLLVFGFSEMTRRDVRAHRFSAFKYRAEEDPELYQLGKKAFKSGQSSIFEGQSPLLVILSAVLFAGLAIAVTGSLVGGLIGAAIGLLMPKAWSDRKKKSQSKTLGAQVEQAAEAMSIILKSGGGIPEALEKVARDVRNPLRRELEQALSEIKLGVPDSDVFQRLAERLNVAEVDMLGIASTLRKEGMAVNMANVLRQIQVNIRARQAFQEEVMAITAENRLAVWVVACVPFFTIAVMQFFAPEFVAPLFTTSIGMFALAISFVFIIAGIIWSLRVASGGSYF